MLPFIIECSLFRSEYCFKNTWTCFNYVNIQFALLKTAKGTVLSCHVVSAHPSAFMEGWIQPPNYASLQLQSSPKRMLIFFNSWAFSKKTVNIYREKNGLHTNTFQTFVNLVFSPKLFMFSFY